MRRAKLKYVPFIGGSSIGWQSFNFFGYVPLLLKILLPNLSRPNCDSASFVQV